MVLLHLLYISTFTWSATSAAVAHSKSVHYTEESPTKIETHLQKDESNLNEEFFRKLSDNCGRNFNFRTPRILNGREAEMGEFPWMASLQKGNPLQHFCGGSIIGPRHILTAAHCVSDVDENGTSYPKGDKITVVLGAHEWNSSHDSPQVQVLKPKKIIYHEKYIRPPATYDIAILILDENIKWSSTRQMICLPSEKFLYGNVNAKAAGWGQTYGETPFYYNAQQSKQSTKAIELPGLEPVNNYDISPTLKAINFTIFNITECKEKWYDGRYNYTYEYGLDNTKICAGSSSLTGSAIAGDTQRGDSGGPLMTLMENGRWSVVGITSATFTLPDPVPGIYTRVSEFLPWIRKHLQED